MRGTLTLVFVDFGGKARNGSQESSKGKTDGKLS
ncbi:hypothetical protein COLO4_07540 [Corchorus olitorius]|uniref:Uncharacterized protein n=1 Tax=Corchorus olitorius TaxID=93759 RepID=A0A1R3KJE6_9ROSI|nr:hypothetical protein COLO4_07540 [Corchorus olitorius]